MKINREEFLNILKKLSFATSGKGVVEEFKCLYFDDNYLFTTDGRIIIRYPYKTDFNCYINLEKTIKYLEKIKDEELHMNMEKDQISFEAENTEFHLNTVQSDSKIEMVDIKEWEDLPEDFYEATQYGLYATSMNEVNQTHEYINILFYKGNSLFSTDNKKISEYRFKTKLKHAFSISNNLADILLKIPNITKYALVDDHLYFKTDNDLIIQCLNKQLEIPEYSKFLEIPKENIDISFHHSILESLDICSIINNDFHDNDKKVYVYIKENQLTCYSKSEIGKVEYRSKLGVKYKNEILFIINPILLRDVLKDKSFNIYYSNELERIFFRNETYSFVTMTIEE